MLTWNFHPPETIYERKYHGFFFAIFHSYQSEIWETRIAYEEFVQDTATLYDIKIVMSSQVLDVSNPP